MSRDPDPGSDVTALESPETTVRATDEPSSRFLRLFTKKRLLLAVFVCMAAYAVLAALLHDPPPAPFAGLDQDAQEHIWHAEHVAFEMETHFGQDFLRALVHRNQTDLRHFVREAFQAKTLDPSVDAVPRRKGIFTETRRTRDRGTVEVEVDGWMRALLGPLEGLETIEGRRLRVLHNDLVNQDAGAWKTQLLLTVVGRRSNRQLVEVVSRHDVWCTFHNDAEIRRGRILDRWEVRSEAVREGTREPLMAEVTAEAGLAQLDLPDNWRIPKEQVSAYRFKTAVADFDRDGDLDVVVATFGHAPMLLRSVQAKRFEEATDELGLRRTVVAVPLTAWIDYDNDGYPDLLLGKHLYHNLQGKRFEDVTDRSGLSFNGTPKACAVADYDGDGRLDLYIAQQYEPTPEGPESLTWVNDDQSGMENQLWRNEGGGRFRDVTSAAGVGGGRRHTFAAVWLHADDDHRPDLYVANDFAGNLLLRNRGDGTFDDVTAASGVGDFATSMGAAAGDLDNDGEAEIYVANMYSKMGRRIIAHVNEQHYPPGLFAQIQGSCAGNRLYRRTAQSKHYTDQSVEMGVNEVGWAYAPAMVDLDGDGLLDLYATTGYVSFDRKKPDG